MLTSVELCAGAGGAARGVERAGFKHLALVENDLDACATLRANRPTWPVVETDLRAWDARSLAGRVDLVCGGVPCPPFSMAGMKLGPDDERNLFDEAIRVVEQVQPTAVMLENVRGLSMPRFANYRNHILSALSDLGYVGQFCLIDCAWFGVPQRRLRTILVAARPSVMSRFVWPEPVSAPEATVGQALASSMAERGWVGAKAWAGQADQLAPTIVGGSKRHGGADLGPSGSRAAWSKLRVKATSLADQPPGPDDPPDLRPRLTNQMVAALQGFEPDWQFVGTKTSVFKQVGNAFPAPAAEAIVRQIAKAIPGPSQDFCPKSGS